MADRSYVSPLGPKITAYITFRRSQGYRFITEADQLFLLDRLAVDMNWASSELGRELVEAFVSTRPGERPRTHMMRASTVRCFGKYLAIQGEDAYVLPVSGFSVGKYDFVPRLLSKEEVRRLFHAADAMTPRANTPIRHIVIPMMLRMIYCCGLRISEARRLRVSDVNIDTGVLLIRNAKFNKDRYVPMAEALTDRCRTYVERIHQHSRPHDPFFPSPRGDVYKSNSGIGAIFRSLLQAADIAHYDDGPTLHSLRHSFAVHRLACWISEGRNVNVMLPCLSAYMGHEGLLGTERYLRITLDMHPDLRNQIEVACAHTIPQVI